MLVGVEKHLSGSKCVIYAGGVSALHLAHMKPSAAGYGLDISTGHACLPYPRAVTLPRLYKML